MIMIYMLSYAFFIAIYTNILKYLKVRLDKHISQTLLPGGQTATKCEIIYFILIIFKDFFILHVSVIVVNRDKLERL